MNGGVYWTADFNQIEDTVKIDVLTRQNFTLIYAEKRNCLKFSSAKYIMNIIYMQ